MTKLRTEIRNAIIILKQQDPQNNFTILESKDGKVKVEVLWAKDETEILIINLIQNYGRI